MEDKPRLLYTEEDVKSLKPRWLELFPHQVDIAETYWTKFDSLYRENQRHYHNFFHMRKLYLFFDEVAFPILNREMPNDKLKASVDTFLYSLWFHDIVYDP